MGKFKDLTGQKFGRLTVIKRAEDYISPKGYKSARWLCECNCKDKNKIIVKGNVLKNGECKSCGCLRKEITYIRGKNNKKYNIYDLTGEYGIGYTLKGEEFYFDLEDYDKIKDYCWRIDKNGYVKSSNINGINKIYLLHKVILPDCKNIIDHINHKKTDNRKINLREVTYTQNNMNRSIRSDNSSGVVGVHWHKLVNKWEVSICINNKNTIIGYFENFEDAVQARKEAEEKYFGEYSYDNSMKKVLLI